MKIKIIIPAFVLSFFLLALNVYSADKVTIVGTETVPGISVTKYGNWVVLPDITGYNGQPVIACDTLDGEAKISWKFTSQIGIGVIRVYLYYPLCEKGSRSAVLKYNSEFQPEKSRTIDLCCGISGWHEVAMYYSSGAGTEISLSADSGILTASALKIVLAGEELSSVVEINNAAERSVIAAYGKKLAYVNGIEQQLKIPAMIFLNEGYISVRDVAKIFGGTVTWDDSTALAEWKTDNAIYTFPLGGDTYSVNDDKKSLHNSINVYKESIMLPMEFLKNELNQNINVDKNGFFVVSKFNIDSMFSEDTAVKNLKTVFDL